MLTGLWTWGGDPGCDGAAVAVGQGRPTMRLDYNGGGVLLNHLLVKFWLQSTRFDTYTFQDISELKRNKFRLHVRKIGEIGRTFNPKGFNNVRFVKVSQTLSLFNLIKMSRHRYHLFSQHNKAQPIQNKEI